MRVLVLGTNYAPEETAVAPFTTGLCEYLAKVGHDVVVITTFPYYPEWRVREAYRGLLYKKDCINGVRLHRIWHFVPHRASNLIQRLGHDLSFTLGALLAGLFVGSFDVLYCVCPPPTLALTAYVLAKIRQRPYVIKLTDLASDAALATGILKDGPAVHAARAIEGFVYRNAHKVVCLCQPFIERLTERGIKREKLQLIPDWGDTQTVYPMAEASAFRNVNGISMDSFLVMHTGNMGKKQDLMNVVRAAELSQDMPDVVWLLVGHGEERAAIEKEIKRRMLKNIKMLPLQPVEKLAEMYSAADVLLLNQRIAIEDSVIPSKLLTYMAAGRAVLAAVSDKSEAARQIRNAQCGLQVPAENPRALLQAVSQLRTDPMLLQMLGANGNGYVLGNFAKEKVLREYHVLFNGYAHETETGNGQTSKNAVETS